ncbi:hypothetical protein MLD38_017945 [Melastoma candidum]|uniref:Uncharacterized protein n=1 Tax=Melastoma candidum TaxID=119954 RepID=A0ACB9QRF6_9MYRT|nr:hypothetical protein MLD38_017945 [Melastoma candidum]
MTMTQEEVKESRVSSEEDGGDAQGKLPSGAPVAVQSAGDVKDVTGGGDDQGRKDEMTVASTSALLFQTINHQDSIQSSSSSSTLFPPFSSSTPIFAPQPQPQLQPQPQPQLQPQPQPQFIPLAFQNPNLSVPPPPPPLPLPLPPQQQQLRPPSFLPVVTVPNAYILPPPGVAAYPSAYSAAIRPVFPPRPLGGLGVFPAVPRPPVPGPPGVRPIFPPVVRPAFVPAAPVEKPQTTVYVGKIAPMVGNDFMLSLLQLCGPVKNWMRPQDPSNGAPKGFGFCEFESAEGVLRALRLLNKLSIDGQELMLNVNQATREYLERYVGKKTEDAKKLPVTEPSQKEGEDAHAAHINESNAEKNNLSSNTDGNLINGETESEKEGSNNANFGVVTDLDKEADKEASQKLLSLIEERLKNKPPPPPPASPAPMGDVLGNGSETPDKPRDKVAGADIDDGSQKNHADADCDSRTTEHDRTEVRSPERNKKYDRRNREHDRERDQQREKEKELERYEREAEREKIRKERDQRRRLEDAEREYEKRLKEWEYREREREKQRQYEKEREKEKERKRRKEIIYDEENDDEDTRKRWHWSALEERRRRRIREKEDDLADRKKEEEEVAEAKKRAEEEEKQQTQRQREALKLFSGNLRGSDDTSPQLEKPTLPHLRVENNPDHENTDDSKRQLGNPDNSTLSSVAITDIQHNSNIPAKKLGFGLVGSGKRAAVPFFFNAEDDDDTHKEKKLRPLVPIDYSTEEIQAVQPSVAGQSQSNLAAAAEFAKRISNASMKEEKPEYDREKSRRSHDRSSQRDKGRNDEDAHRAKDKNHDRDREREQGFETLKPSENKKLWDAKQLIDMIPRTKEDLFSYEINWALYDQHAVHERMRPWISKKIMEFLGEEETSLVDFIVSSTQEHVKAAEMLETLKSILDEEAEMFVLKMWRMLIFEIKKIETGLHLRSRS